MAELVSFEDTAKSGSGPSRTFPASIDEGRPPKPDDFLLPHFLEGRRVVVVTGDSSLGGGSGWDETAAVLESHGITISIVVSIVAKERSSSATKGLRLRRYERTEEQRRRRGRLPRPPF
jgi:hypothetical protein